MNQSQSIWKDKLEKEKSILETELSSVGRINPNNSLDWEARPQDLDTDEAERTEVADKIEGFDTNIAILNDLEIRYNEVKGALQRIEDGTYGVCKVCGKEIEEERLEANPASTTCIADINK